MTEVALQSELMSYADRFASIMIQAIEDFSALKPDPETRYFVMSDGVYSVSGVFNIAAEPYPQVAYVIARLTYAFISKKLVVSKT